MQIGGTTLTSYTAGMSEVFLLFSVALAEADTCTRKGDSLKRAQGEYVRAYDPSSIL